MNTVSAVVTTAMPWTKKLRTGQPPLRADTSPTSWMVVVGVGVGVGVGLGDGGPGTGDGGPGTGDGVAASCSTAIDWPAATTVPLRAVPAFGANPSDTVALPLTFVGLAMLIHGDWLDAVHAQLASVAETDRAAVPPAAGAFRVDGLTLNRHGAGSWETVSCWLLTFSAPLLARGAGLASTVKLRVPVPVPCAGDARLIHDACVEADQLHSRAASMVALPLPPDGPKAPVNPFTEIWHFWTRRSDEAGRGRAACGGEQRGREGQKGQANAENQQNGPWNGVHDNCRPPPHGQQLS